MDRGLAVNVVAYDIARAIEHCANGCETLRSRSRLRLRLACYTKDDRRAARQISDRRRVYLCAGGLRKRR